jgi:hypothetical protein
MSFDNRTPYVNTSEYIRDSQNIPELSRSEIQAILASGRSEAKLVRARTGEWQFIVDGQVRAKGSIYECTDAFRRFKGIA